MRVAVAAFLQRKYRFDISDVAKLRCWEGLARSQAVGDTEVAHSSSSSNEPRVGSHRRDRPSLFNDVNVDVVPAIVNGSSWDGVSVYGGDADERERENQGEESDHRRHLSLQSWPIERRRWGYGGRLLWAVVVEGEKQEALRRIRNQPPPFKEPQVNLEQTHPNVENIPGESPACGRPRPRVVH